MGFSRFNVCDSGFDVCDSRFDGFAILDLMGDSDEEEEEEEKESEEKEGEEEGGRKKRNMDIWTSWTVQLDMVLFGNGPIW
ncbi:hypothetical protein F2Q68_00019997 [Brassica cretica]|uniref:Uncharacterized protein n=1 Tax=Brassica cretica TaxID=69181 RepID=A0A8S9G700_BRACR|nr:hypothetical protein F2Q68_00019997 [Brassica cretica]